mgnify:CR=1 FL=1
MPSATAGGTPDLPIAIAGAGIGGLTAALTLAAAGFRVEIAERAEKPSEVGAGIQITPNAGRVLAYLGLDGAMAKVAIEPAAIEVHNGIAGRRLTSVPGSAFRERYGFPYRVLHRADLQALLADAVAHHADIRLRLGATVAGAEDTGERIAMRLAGGEAIDAAALIAADGVRSTLRAALPGAAQASPAGRTAWRAVVPVDKARAPSVADTIGLWLGPDAHLVHYPVAHGKAVNIVAIVAKDATGTGWDVPGDPTEIAERFSGWSAAVRRLIASAESWQTFALAAVGTAGPWTAGRLALLGDAAHAMMPFLAQGAAMAIEDAARLAHALVTTPGDVPAALRTYESVRKQRVARVRAASLTTGEVYHLGAAMAVARDAALSVAGRSLILARNDWIYRWLPPAEEGSG